MSTTNPFRKMAMVWASRVAHKNKSSTKNIAITQLCSAAIFFAMRSCEYLLVNIPEERTRTRTLQLRNLRFFMKGCKLLYTDSHISLADTVSITFEFQKNDERHESVTMHRSGENICYPVRSWAEVVHRVLFYPGTNQDSTVNTILVNGNLKTISSSTVRSKLCSTAQLICKDTLGFKPSDIGIHSIISGAASQNISAYQILIY